MTRMVKVILKNRGNPLVKSSAGKTPLQKAKKIKILNAYNSYFKPLANKLYEIWKRAEKENREIL